MSEATRCWCAQLQWTGKRPFIFGTVSIRASGTLQEVEAAIWDEWSMIAPDECARPNVLNLMPGMLVFNREE